MINKIRHIITIFGAISLIAMAMTGCKQNVTPEVDNSPAQAVKYTVTFQSDIGVAPDAIKVEADYVLKDQDIKGLAVDGYNFIGWFDGDKKVMAGYKVTKNVTFKAKWESKPFAVSSIKLDRNHFYFSELDKSSKTELKVTLKGTGFNRLKDNDKINVAIYNPYLYDSDTEFILDSDLITPEIFPDARVAGGSLGGPAGPGPAGQIGPVPVGPGPAGQIGPVPVGPGVPEENPLFVVPAVIDYENNTATATIKMADFTRADEMGITDADETNADKIAPEDADPQVAEIPINVFVNDEPVGKSAAFIISGKSFLFNDLDLLGIDPDMDLSDLGWGYQFDLSDTDCNIDMSKFIIASFIANPLLCNVVYKIYDENNVQIGDDIPLDPSFYIDSNYIAFTSIDIPKKNGTYTVKIFINNVEQKTIYADSNNPVPVVDHTFTVIGEPVIESVTVPVAELGKIVDVIIKGSSFSPNSKFYLETADNSGITGKFIYVDSKTYKLQIKAPDTAGTYKITIKAVNNDNQSFTKDFIVNNTVSISYESDYASESIPADQSGLSKGTVINKPADLSKNGYNFEGWFINGVFEPENKVTENIILNESIVLKAKWSLINYKINYMNCEDTVNDNPEDYNIESEDYTFNVPVKSGFEFMGWYTDSNFDEKTKKSALNKGSTGPLTLYAKWKDIAPSPVSNFIAIFNGENTFLSWDEPDITDLKKVVITYDGKTVEVEKGSNSVIVEDAEPGTEFSLTVYDKGDNKSTAVVIKSMENSLTEQPSIIRTRVIGNSSHNVIKFGDWPQTVKPDNVTIKDKEPSKYINGWPCYLGSDGFYYVKETSYIRNNPYFDNGNKIYNNKEYYFRLEPIEWLVLTEDYNGSGKKILLAEMALMTGKFDMNSNSYVNSEIRARLNGLDKVVSSPNGYGDDRNYNGKGFLQKAFSESAAALIANTNIDNGADGSVDATPATPATPASPENDKIFLLSLDDVESADLGFPTNTELKRKNTDYTLATGGWEDSGNPNGWWWTRTDYASTHAYRVTKNGGTESYSKEDAATSIVPALCLEN